MFKETISVQHQRREFALLARTQAFPENKYSQEKNNKTGTLGPLCEAKSVGESHWGPWPSLGRSARGRSYHAEGWTDAKMQTSKEKQLQRPRWKPQETKGVSQGVGEGVLDPQIVATGKAQTTSGKTGEHEEAAGCLPGGHRSLVLAQLCPRPVPGRVQHAD